MKCEGFFRAQAGLRILLNRKHFYGALMRERLSKNVCDFPSLCFISIIISFAIQIAASFDTGL